MDWCKKYILYLRKVGSAQIISVLKAQKFKNNLREKSKKKIYF